jgi:hypothetical protein
MDKRFFVVVLPPSCSLPRPLLLVWPPSFSKKEKKIENFIVHLIFKDDDEFTGLDQPTQSIVSKYSISKSKRKKDQLRPLISSYVR